MTKILHLFFMAQFFSFPALATNIEVLVESTDHEQRKYSVTENKQNIPIPKSQWRCIIVVERTDIVKGFKTTPIKLACTSPTKDTLVVPTVCMGADPTVAILHIIEKGQYHIIQLTCDNAI